METKPVEADSRQEHMEWCKKRALEYCDLGDLQAAFSSLSSDLGKHLKTKDHPAILLGAALLLGGHLNTEQEMRKFIEGCN